MFGKVNRNGMRNQKEFVMRRSRRLSKFLPCVIADKKMTVVDCIFNAFGIFG